MLFVEVSVIQGFVIERFHYIMYTLTYGKMYMGCSYFTDSAVSVQKCHVHRLLSYFTESVVDVKQVIRVKKLMGLPPALELLGCLS